MNGIEYEGIIIENTELVLVFKINKEVYTNIQNLYQDLQSDGNKQSSIDPSKWQTFPNDLLFKIKGSKLIFKSEDISKSNLLFKTVPGLLLQKGILTDDLSSIFHFMIENDPNININRSRKNIPR